MKLQRLACLALVGLSLLAAAPGQAQEFPSKPIQFVIGPSPDLLPRLLAPKLGEAFKQPIVIDQRPGAGGLIAGDLVAKAAPDGHTWLMSSASFIIVSSFSPNVPFNLAKDFEPVILMSGIPFVLVTNPGVPAKTLPELIALARAQPGKLNYASSGSGGSGHMLGEMFKNAARIDVVHVPYKGVAPSVSDLLGGQVQYSFIVSQAALPHVKSGKLRALAVTSLKRSIAAPELPTIAESGFPGFEMIGWNGIHVPAKTPRAVVQKINTEVARALSLPDVRERMLVGGFEPTPTGIEDFDAYVKSDLARYTKVIKESKIVFE